MRPKRSSRRRRLQHKPSASFSPIWWTGTSMLNHSSCRVRRSAVPNTTFCWSRPRMTAFMRSTRIALAAEPRSGRFLCCRVARRRSRMDLAGGGDHFDSCNRHCHLGNNVRRLDAELASGGTFRLHALDISSGAEKNGGPVEIHASVPATNKDSKGGVETLTTSCLQRAALLLENGTIVIGFGSCHSGWVVSSTTRVLWRRLACST